MSLRRRKMSIHKSLSSGDRLRKHRNGLTRDERIVRLEKEGRWKDGGSVLGLPKVRNIKVVARKKAKKKEKAPAVETAATEEKPAEEAR